MIFKKNWINIYELDRTHLAQFCSNLLLNLDENLEFYQHFQNTNIKLQRNYTLPVKLEKIIFSVTCKIKWQSLSIIWPRIDIKDYFYILEKTDRYSF